MDDGQKKRKSKMKDERKKKKKKSSEIESNKEEDVDDHQAELDALEEGDPEFYAFLQENDKDLLKFQQGEADEEMEEEDEEEDEATPSKTNRSSVELTRKDLEDLQKKKSCGIAALVKLAKRACNENSFIADPALRIDAMHFAAKELGRMLTAEHSRVKGVIKSYATALTTNTAGSILPLEAARCLRFLSQFVQGQIAAKIGSRLVRGLVDVFARSNVLLEEHDNDQKAEEADDSEDAKKLQVEAFLRLREIILASSSAKKKKSHSTVKNTNDDDDDDENNLTEYALRKSYSAFTATAGKQSATNAIKNARRAANIAFIAAAVANLFDISNTKIGYRLAFGYVRQLALAVRSALADPQGNAASQILSWRFLHASRLWSAVATNAMTPLVFPLCQILFGALQLAGNQAKYAPYRLHCIKLLHALCARRELYVPTVKPLMTILEHFLTTKIVRKADPKSKKRKSTTSLEAAVILDRILSLSDEDLHNRIFQDEIIRETTNLLSDWLEICRYTIGLPELLVVPVIDFKRILKAQKSSSSSASKTAIACAKSSLAAFTSAAQHASNLRIKAFGNKSVADLLDLGFEPLKPPSLPSAADRLQRRRMERADRKAKLLDEESSLPLANSGGSSATTSVDHSKNSDSQKKKKLRAADFFRYHHDDEVLLGDAISPEDDNEEQNNSKDIITALNIDDF